MLIYKITNKTNQKSYIGQTVHKSFNKRYSGGRWWDMTDNPLLTNAYNKYGIESFSVEILERDVESLDKLNQLEEFYAEKYNTYYPNGYNLRKCGDNRRLLDHQIQLIKQNKSKTYKLRKIDTWEEIEIFNLKEFCKKNGLTWSPMYNMIKGRDNVIVSQGYCLASKTKQEVQDRKMRRFKNKTFELADDKGNLIKVSNIKEFLKIHNLGKGSFYKLLNGKMLYYRGFRLPHRIGEEVSNVVEFELLSPDNKIVRGNNLSRFCRNNNLEYNCIRKVINGEIWKHQGWMRPDTTGEELATKGQRYKKPITLISPIGDEVIVDDLKPFCFKNGLDYSLFYSLYKGYNQTAMGWTKKENLENISKKIIHVDGKIISLIGRGSKKKFCNDNNLNYGCFINMIAGKEKQYKGWKLLK